MTVTDLRKKHPVFRYTKAWHQVEDGALSFFAQFEIGNEISFTPKVTFPELRTITEEVLLNQQILDQIAFFIGFAEIPSYWKATCSPQLHIDAGPISSEHKQFLRKLLTEGLGEFYFVNSITSFADDEFLTIHHSKEKLNPFTINTSLPKPEKTNYLLPLGGGKDSLVSLELLKQYVYSKPSSQDKLGIFVLEPASPAASKIAQLSGLPTITAQRTIDPKLLELNQQGYLNGHTPFSAYLSMLSSFVGVLYGYSQIVLSNERSANEGNLNFYGMEINHQWSKSEEYEALFRDLSENHLSLEMPNYFSLLRPLYELQIAAIFATQYEENPEILTTFKSCNRGQRKNVWCGECPKCLFAYLLLAPFITPDQLETIFGQNLLKKESLTQTATDLLGEGSNKPLECVGMYQESLVASYLAIERWYGGLESDQTKPLPVVLDHIAQTILSKHLDISQQATQLLQGWNNQHNLPANLAQWLKETLHEVTSQLSFDQLPQQTPQDQS